MSSDVQNTLLLVGGMAVQLIGILIGLYLSQRRFPLERIEKHAEAANDFSEADLRWQQATASRIDNYERMYELVAKRGEELLELRRTSAAEIDELRTKVVGLIAQHQEQQRELNDLQRQLETEIKARRKAEGEAASLRQQLETLQKKYDALREEFNAIKAKESQGGI